MMLGTPTPTPTAMAIMSEVPKAEEEEGAEVGEEVDVGLVVLGVLGVVVPVLPVDVSVCLGPAGEVDVALPLPPLPSPDPESPVATAASAETTAVVVLLGCGFESLPSHENITDLAL